MAQVRIEKNETLWNSEDLRRLFSKGLDALGCKRERNIQILKTPEPSRGIAYVGTCSGARGSCPHSSDGPPAKNVGGSCETRAIVLMLPVPSKMDLRRLSRLFEHEYLHTMGKEHEEMTSAEYWSTGPLPKWARGARVRYDGRPAWKDAKEVHAASSPRVSRRQQAPWSRAFRAVRKSVRRLFKT